MIFTVQYQKQDTEQNLEVVEIYLVMHVLKIRMQCISVKSTSHEIFLNTQIQQVHIISLIIVTKFCLSSIFIRILHVHVITVLVPY